MLNHPLWKQSTWLYKEWLYKIIVHLHRIDNLQKTEGIICFQLYVLFSRLAEQNKKYEIVDIH